MRIAELTSYTSRLNGGVFFALSSLLPEVSRRMPDGEVRVFGYADRHTEEDRAAWNPVQLEAFRPWRPSVFGYSPRFFPALEGYRADLVHAHGLWTYLSAAALREHRRTGTPVVISPRTIEKISPRFAVVLARAASSRSGSLRRTGSAASSAANATSRTRARPSSVPAPRMASCHRIGAIMAAIITRGVVQPHSGQAK